MPDLAAKLAEPEGGFSIGGMMMRYNVFMPRLYNFCLSLGFQPGKIMPSRAFCTDESQGYPIIMITKHFGTFPFNHGTVGGIVATDRHGPYSEHGKDLIIIQASHVGYDADTKTFGTYRRLHTEPQHNSPTCGKVDLVLDWYLNEYRFACENILLHLCQGVPCITIDNYLLREDREQGLLLKLEKLVQAEDDDSCRPVSVLSTSKTFIMNKQFSHRLHGITLCEGRGQPIGQLLGADLFYYKRNIQEQEEGRDHLERNLIKFMPTIVTARAPLLIAAQINTQIEFDRTFRTIVRERCYRGKKIVFVAGLNIDISPQEDQLFPLTKFVPWAAYIQDDNNQYRTMEQNELVAALRAQSAENPHQIDLEEAIQKMAVDKEINIT